jgi:signal transduction histidine kinase
VLAQVFEPFFTTKGPGKGTGLGLSMVYGFAEQSEGEVTIDSVLGQGPAVVLYLPLAPLEDHGEA